MAQQIKDKKITGCVSSASGLQVKTSNLKAVLTGQQNLGYLLVNNAEGGAT